jgi:hypothetical protein
MYFTMDDEGLLGADACMEIPFLVLLTLLAAAAALFWRPLYHRFIHLEYHDG